MTTQRFVQRICGGNINHAPTQGLIEDAINRKDISQLQFTLSALDGQYAAKYILNILLDDDSYKTDEWIKSVLEMLP